jgi:glucuronate isomerase
MDRFENTVQYRWFIDILKVFLGFEGDRVSAGDTDRLCDLADRCFGQPDWEQQVFQRSNLERIFLTNEFDDKLDGFDMKRYVPCLRTDTLVFRLHEPAVKRRLATVTGIEVEDPATARAAIRKLFERFTAAGAKACAISLPPSFAPLAVTDVELAYAMRASGDEALLTRGIFEAVHMVRNVLGSSSGGESTPRAVTASGMFMMLAEHCREFGLPFDLMIGVNRDVYPNGVHQGRDLFDQRVSLIQYRALFNAFPEVTFPISVLSSGQNQELVSHAWIFPNVVTNGHWWYSNIPTYIRSDLTARLQAVPRSKQIGYYSDAYKLEFVLPKYDMYRQILATVLADDFVRPGLTTEAQAVDLARHILRDNAQRIFKI